MPIDKSWPGYNKGIEPADGFEWIWQEAIPADVPNRDPAVVSIPFGYEKRVLAKGWKKTPENKAVDLDIIFEKDVEFAMRDGVKVRVSATINRLATFLICCSLRLIDLTSVLTVCFCFSYLPTSIDLRIRKGQGFP